MAARICCKSQNEDQEWHYVYTNGYAKLCLGENSGKADAAEGGRVAA